MTVAKQSIGQNKRALNTIGDDSLFAIKMKRALDLWLTVINKISGLD